MFRSAAVVALAAALTASPAAAQTRQPAPPPARPAQPVRRPPPPVGQTRGFLTFGAGGQFGSKSFSETHTDTINLEQETWTASYPTTTAVEFEGGGGWRLWRSLFAAGTFDYAQSTRRAGVTAEIPHPFFFNRPRSIAGDSAGLAHNEQAVHLSALWNVPLARRVELDLFGGPSLLRVSRELVSTVQYTEEYPYDTATFSRATVGETHTSKVGAHAGVNLAWLLNPRLGVGATVRYTTTTVELATPSGGSVGFDVGGLQATVGLRVNFRSRPRTGAPPRLTPPPPRRR